MRANPPYCNLVRMRKDGLSGFDGAPLTGGRGLHDDNLVGRNQVQGRADPLVEQVGIEVIGLKLGNLQVKLLALRASCLEIGVRGPDLPRQAQPPDKAAVAFDQVINKIAGQGDADNRANNIMRPPPQFAQYDHWSAP